MIIQAFPSGPLVTNAYVVACAQTKEAVCIDPAPHSFEALDRFVTDNQLLLRKIFLTHSHWDHIADVTLIKEKYAIPVCIHALDAPNLINPGFDQLPCPVHILPVEPDYYLLPDEIFLIGRLKFQALHTPGHSPGSVCFYEETQHALFSGDTLFCGTMGNVSFPTSIPNLMESSLARLASLPPQTKVYPGHGDTTTIRVESAWLLQVKKLFNL